VVDQPHVGEEWYGDDVSDQMLVRLQKMEEWRERGKQPYGGRYAFTHQNAEIVERFTELEGSAVSLAGRLLAVRGHGKASFADLQDPSGRLQLYARLDKLGEEAYEDFRRLDIGDIVGLSGTVFRTRRGEISVEVEGFELLAKALRPLPEKWHGLKDVELRYRMRYLDLIANPQVSEIFRSRSAAISSMREYLVSRDFLEVETPVLHPIAGGANARPFLTYHNALDMQLYLRIAPELYLKRLLQLLHIPSHKGYVQSPSRQKASASLAYGARCTKDAYRQGLQVNPHRLCRIVQPLQGCGYCVGVPRGHGNIELASDTDTRVSHHRGKSAETHDLSPAVGSLAARGHDLF
jgi:hypothetical protein